MLRGHTHKLALEQNHVGAQMEMSNDPQHVKINSVERQQVEQKQFPGMRMYVTVGTPFSV